LNYLELRAAQEKRKTLLNYCTKHYTISRISAILKTGSRVSAARLDTQKNVHEE